MDSSSSSGSTTSAARTALRPETGTFAYGADRRRMMPVLGDIVKTLSGCGEYDGGWNWSEVSVDRVGEIIDGPSYAGWVTLRWEDGSESGKIWPHGFDTPTGHRPTLMNLSGQERMLIAALAMPSAATGGAALESALAQLRAEYSELGETSEALAAVRGVDTEVV